MTKLSNYSTITLRKGVKDLLDKMSWSDLLELLIKDYKPKHVSNVKEDDEEDDKEYTCVGGWYKGY